MWIRRKTYKRVQTDLAQLGKFLDTAQRHREDINRLLTERDEELDSAQKKYRALEARVNFAENSFEWLRVLFNRVERERTALLEQLSGRPLRAMAIERSDTAKRGTVGKPIITLDGAPIDIETMFADLGDDFEKQTEGSED